MRRFLLTAAGLATLACAGLAQEYKLVKTVKVGGAGGFDYVYADEEGRRLYIPRPGATGARITVFDLDTLAPVGEIPNANARGVAVDPKSHHGFGSSKPVVMWDTKTLATIKTIDVDGGPDGILFDPFNARVWVFSHRAPNATVIDAKEGAVVGTVDLGGAPEQAVSDGKGHIWVDIEDKDNIAAVDAKTLKVTAHYDLAGKCGGPGGLALDEKHHILFAACHDPANMAMVNAEDGKIITTLPIGKGVDGAGFNPKTMEAFSSQGDGTLTVIKEKSPTDFVVAQNVQTKMGARTMTVDTKTGQVFSITGEFTPPPPGQRRGQMVPDSFSIVVVGK
ncbi:MAG TPA: YncE family protein [Bryobacteraceae bacterium]|nr:YncE family protein [Bryobacteraceae bacterium]